MSGYAASARLRGGSLRFVPTGPGRPLTTPEDAETESARLDREPVERLSRPVVERLAERWDDLRVTWSQTTFFLFSADGWR